MTVYEQWLKEQSVEFKRGYDAAAEGYPRFRNALAEWLRGYDAFHAYMNRSERARYV